MPEYNYPAICAVLHNGGVVALPTDTVLGLAVDPSNTLAVDKLYKIKAREPQKPLVYMIHSIAQLVDQVVLTDDVKTILSKYWPGALTVVFQKKDSLETIGYRIPNNDFMLGLLRFWDKPLGVTSANVSGQKELTTMAEVENTFGNAIDLYVYANDSQTGVASTIIDVSSAGIKILRQGDLKI